MPTCTLLCPPALHRTHPHSVLLGPPSLGPVVIAATAAATGVAVAVAVAAAAVVIVAAAASATGDAVAVAIAALDCIQSVFKVQLICSPLFIFQ